MGRGTSTTGTTGALRRSSKDVHTAVLSRSSRPADKPCEDAVLLEKEHGLAVVADGMGSYKGGSEAAQAAVEAAAFLAAAMPARDKVVERYRWVQSSLPMMSTIVRDRMTRMQSEGGATAAIAVLAEDADNGAMAFVASVGDARAYRFSATSGELSLLTDDDSLLGEANFDEVESREELSEAEHLLFKQRHNVTDALGKMRADALVQVEPADLEEGDLLVLCSDGVHDNLTGTEIAAICRDSRPEDLADRLVEAARARSLDESHYRHKDDDISCVVLDPAA